MSKHVMLDLETLGNNSQPVIISIGAVVFDTETFELGEEFYRVVDAESCVQNGMKMDASTVMWWMQQSVEAKVAFKEKGKHINRILDDFRVWYPTGACIWGNGAVADNVWMANAYRLSGLKAPWSYRDDRRYRTLRALYPDVKADPMDGVAHNALDDAKYQALHAMKIIKEKGLRL